MIEKSNKSITRRALVAQPAATLLAMALAASAVQAATPEQACEGGKNDASGKYAACVLKAEKSFVTGGDGPKYAAALTKCEGKMISSWSKLEQKAVEAATTCPTTGDQSAIGDFLDACTQSVAVAVGGGTLPLDVIDCNDELAVCGDDLTTCEADLLACEDEVLACEDRPAAFPLQSGQALCYTAGGAATPCAGTGQDGETQPGVPREYVDNGDGTITDLATGLMWEKQSDNGDIHDKDNGYTWNNAFATKIATLNATSFAGHTDWRLPTIYELETLKDFQAATSPIVPAEFNSGCIAGCSNTTCSCTDPVTYWTSTTYALYPSSAWTVRFGPVNANADPKGGAAAVRAVRIAIAPTL